MHPSRLLEIINLLVKYPMTAEMIFRASENFHKPYRSIGTLRNDLKHLIDRKLLNRQRVPSIKVGEKEYVYFPNREIRKLSAYGRMTLPEATFEGFHGQEWHSEAVSEFMSHVERSAGQQRDHIQILATVQDRYFKTTVATSFMGEERQSKLEPDQVLLVQTDKEISLLFLEMWNFPALINPRKPESVGRSVRYRMAKYKTFAAVFKKHDTVNMWQVEHHVSLNGFRVLMVTTRNEQQRDHMLRWAKHDGYRSMFYFATMDDIRSCDNLFTEPVWHLPSGTVRGLADI